MALDTVGIVGYATDMEPLITLVTFTPAEAERRTGLSATMQRDWRRHGYIESSDGGHARYNVFELASMIAMRALAGHVPLKEAKEIAYWAKNRIALTALKWSDAWSVSDDLAHPMGDAADWGVMADWLTRKAWSTFIPGSHGRVIPGGKLIIWADGSHYFHESLDAAFASKTSSDDAVQGAVVVVDLDALGVALIEEGGKPFAVAVPTTTTSHRRETEDALTAGGATPPAKSEGTNE